MDCIGGNTVQKTEQYKKTTYILKLCVCARENYISTIISSGSTNRLDQSCYVFCGFLLSLTLRIFNSYSCPPHVFCYSILKLRFFLFKNDIYNIYNLHYSTVLRVIWYLTAYIEGKNIHPVHMILFSKSKFVFY